MSSALPHISHKIPPNPVEDPTGQIIALNYWIVSNFTIITQSRKYRKARACFSRDRFDRVNIFTEFCRHIEIQIPSIISSERFN